jgi:hypothetical protein
MSDDREKARALLEEAKPHIDPALYALLGLILDRQEAILWPHEAPTKPRPKPPPLPSEGTGILEFKKAAAILIEKP